MKKKITFTKMEGAGNDFLVIDAQKGIPYRRLAPKACHRTEGVGADGLLILDKSKKADYKMRIINADGSEAEMCGNGARCMAAYIKKVKRPKKKLFSIETKAGLLHAEAKGEVANVNLSDPVGYKPDIPLTILGRKVTVHYIDTGVPHSILYVHGLPSINVSGIGNHIRFHKKFAPRGTNVDFVEQIGNNTVDVRTYERGVEDETRACGTGSVASALVTYLKTHSTVKNKKKATVKVRTASKEILNVNFDVIDSKVRNVWLKGSAKFIAKGEYYV